MGKGTATKTNSGLTAHDFFIQEPEEKFKNLLYEQVEAFFSEGKNYDDGSPEYRKRVIEATSISPISNLDSKVDVLFQEAVKVNPVFANTHQEFRLVKVPLLGTKRDEKELFTAALMPRYSAIEQESLIYTIWSSDEQTPAYDDGWNDALVRRAVIFNIGYEDLSTDNESLKELLVPINPLLTDSKVGEFIARVNDDPAMEIRYSVSPDGKYLMPPSLKAYLFDFVSCSPPDKLVGRPDIDELIRGDLEKLAKYQAQLQKGETPCVSPHNRLFIGPGGSGKTTAGKYFIYEANKLGIPTFELGRGMDGQESQNLAAMFTKAFQLIGLYALAAKTYCIVWFDDFTELLSPNQKATLERDDLVTALKRSIGGSGENPYVVVVATGNNTNIDASFLTKKRFGKPYLFESTPEIQVELAYQRKDKLGITGFPENRGELLSFLKSLPVFSNEDIASLLDSTYENHDQPAYNDFLTEVTREIIGTDQQQELSALELSHRAAYAAGLITAALSLGELPYAAKINPTSESDMPGVFFNISEENRMDLIKYFLTTCAGKVALDIYSLNRSKDPSEIYTTPILQFAETICAREVGELVDSNGVSSLGVDTLSTLRAEKMMKLETWVYEDTQQTGFKVASDILAKNLGLFWDIYSLLLDKKVLYMEDLKMLSGKEVSLSEIPKNFYAKAGPHNYVDKITVTIPPPHSSESHDCSDFGFGRNMKSADTMYKDLPHGKA